MAKNAVLSIDDAWNAVALEERLKLISRSKADGLTASVICFLIVGAIGYGFDQIMLLAVGAGLALFVMPMFSSYSWRKAKPDLILSYLAVRSIARRYAYGYKIQDLDIILIFRGQLEEQFSSREEEEFARQQQTINFDTQMSHSKEVWICLMRGAIVLLSERLGGARLEYLCPVNAELSVTKPKSDGDESAPGVLITGGGAHRGRKVLVSSQYPGALYVFEKQLQCLSFEVAQSKEQFERFRKAEAEKAAKNF